MKKIFISHASKDKDLIDAFVDLLNTGIGINPHDIFCTSLESMGIPAGENFVDFINKQLGQVELILTIITDNFLESQFCLTELGASWIMKKVYTIIVPPITFGDVKTILGEIQFANIIDKSSLNELRDSLIKILNISSPVPTARWEVKRDQFLEKFNEIIKKIPKPMKVKSEEHQKLVQAYKESLKVVTEKEGLITVLQITIEELKKLKDKKEVAEVTLKTIDTDLKKFEIIIDKILEAWDAFTPYTQKVVIETCFYHFKGEEFLFDRDLDDRVKDAVERKYLELILRDNVASCVPNIRHPKIREILSLLDKLMSFVKSVGHEFSEWYEDKYEDCFDVESRAFWERHLGL